MAFTPEDMLTPRQGELLELADELYGVRATQSVTTFSRALGTDEEVHARLLTGLAAYLQTLDFHEKKQVADVFRG